MQNRSRPPLDITRRGHVLLIEPTEHTVGVEAGAAREQVLAELDAAPAQTAHWAGVLLSKVNSLNSKGIGTIIAIGTALRSRGIPLHLVDPQPSVRTVLQDTNVDRVFPIVPAPPSEPSSGPRETGSRQSRPAATEEYVDIVQCAYERELQRRQEAEAGLRALNEALDARVRERTAEVSSAYEQLRRENHERRRAEEELKNAQAQLVQSERLAAIGQLAAGVAHEINSPLGFVAANSETLAGYLNGMTRIVRLYRAGEDPAAIRRAEEELDIDYVLDDAVDLLKDNADGLARITEIVRNLRSFARIDQTNKHTEADLNEGVRSALLMARNEIKYVAETTTDLGDIPRVVCNMGEINQVLLNIFVNAAHAIKDGERPGKGRVSVRTFDDNASVYCEIADNGPGIPPEVRDKIFEPFFTTKETGKGTGLGLSISYDIIVNRHGGDITVDTSAEKGTTFSIKLPKVERSRDQG